MRPVAISPVPIVHRTLSPAVLDPALGPYFEPEEGSLPKAVQLAVRCHPWVLRDGWLAGGSVRLVVAPIGERALRGARLVIATDIDDAETSMALRAYAEAGGKLLRAAVEKSDAPGVIPDDLIRSIPPGADVRLPRGLLPGLPVGFGEWTKQVYRLPSSAPQTPVSYCLVVGEGAPSVAASSLLRFNPPPLEALSNKDVIARALRVALLLAEDVLILPEARASALAAALATLEGTALFRAIPPPMEIIREIAEAAGVPPVLASQIYEASVAIAACGLDMDETETTRWGMSSKALFPLIRAGHRHAVQIDVAISIVDLGKRTALDEKAWILCEPRTLVVLRYGSIATLSIYPGVVPDPSQRGGDLPALFVVRSPDPNLEDLQRVLREHSGELVEVVYRRLGGRLHVISAVPIRVHALEPLLDQARQALARIEGGGWFERASEVGLRIQLAIPSEEESEEGGEDSGKKAGARGKSRRKGKAGRRRNG